MVCLIYLIHFNGSNIGISWMSNQLLQHSYDYWELFQQTWLSDELKEIEWDTHLIHKWVHAAKKCWLSMVERHSFLECKPIWPNNLPRNRSTMQHNHLRHAWNNTIPLSTKVVQQPDCCPETCQSLKILKVKVIINTGAVNTSSD